MDWGAHNVVEAELAIDDVAPGAGMGPDAAPAEAAGSDDGRSADLNLVQAAQQRHESAFAHRQPASAQRGPRAAA